jgi:hypothetical protein
MRRRFSAAIGRRIPFTNQGSEMSYACQTARVLGASSTGRWPIESMPPGTCWSSNQSSTKPHRLAAPARLLPLSGGSLPFGPSHKTMAQALVPMRPALLETRPYQKERGGPREGVATEARLARTIRLAQLGTGCTVALDPRARKGLEKSCAAPD